MVRRFGELLERRDLHNSKNQILHYVQNDKWILFCHAEFVEASCFSGLSTYAKLSLERKAD